MSLPTAPASRRVWEESRCIFLMFEEHDILYIDQSLDEDAGVALDGEGVEVTTSKLGIVATRSMGGFGVAPSASVPSPRLTCRVWKGYI